MLSHIMCVRLRQPFTSTCCVSCYAAACKQVICLFVDVACEARLHYARVHLLLARQRRLRGQLLLLLLPLLLHTDDDRGVLHP